MADADTEPKSVDQETLVADIDRTRAELARTIDAISDRVSPKKNIERAKGQLRERVIEIDPIMAGAAAAAMVVASPCCSCCAAVSTSPRPQARPRASRRSSVSSSYQRPTAGRAAARGRRCHPGPPAPGTSTRRCTARR